MTRHPLSQKFHDILSELGKLHDKKQSDYGRPEDPFSNFKGAADWGVDDWKGAMIRASDKVKRLQTYARTKKLENEGVIDSLNDLAVYTIIARVLFEDSHPGTLDAGVSTPDAK